MPLATGAIRPTAASLIPLSVAVIASALVLRGDLGKSPAQRVVVALCSLMMTVGVSDLVAHPFLQRVLWVRANAMFGHRWERLPLLQRYPPNIRYEGRMFGDLASGTGVPADREWRQETFTTDAQGFRNAVDPDAAARPLQLLLVGDSFAEGANTAQAETLPQILARDYGYRLRNLAMGGAGPWDEYVNLSLEFDRLPAAPDLVILWLLFMGNDLDDPCYPMLDVVQLPWNGALRSAMQAYGSFRERSPIRVITDRARGTIGRWLGREGASTRVARRDFMRVPMLFYTDIMNRRGRTLDEVLHHRNWPCIQAVFGAMKALGERRHFRVAVATVPSKEDVYAWVLDGGEPWSSPEEGGSLTAAFKRLSQEQGFSFLDLQPALVRASRDQSEQSGATLWWRDDVHWNGAGQKVAADAIVGSLLQPRRAPPSSRSSSQ